MQASHENGKQHDNSRRKQDTRTNKRTTEQTKRTDRRNDTDRQTDTRQTNKPPSMDPTFEACAQANRACAHLAAQRSFVGNMVTVLFTASYKEMQCTGQALNFCRRRISWGHATSSAPPCLGSQFLPTPYILGTRPRISSAWSIAKKTHQNESREERVREKKRDLSLGE